MLSRTLHRMGHLRRRLVTQTLLRPLFGAIGRRTTLYPFAMLVGSEHVRIGSRTLIRRGCRLEIIRHGQPWTPEITIGDDVNIEQNVHIVCHDRIRIGDRVSITAGCAIVDVTHQPGQRLRGRSDIDTGRSYVEIGDGSFLGYGAVVLPNVRIGRGCFVGAGSVVTRDLPDHAVAAGVPARVLRLMDQPATTQAALPENADEH